MMDGIVPQERRRRIIPTGDAHIHLADDPACRSRSLE
jgi:hypothetical protein